MRHTLLTKEYDKALGDLIRYNLKAHGLDIPGTVYFDDGLYVLSTFYSEKPDKRCYFVLLDDDDRLLGGIGLAECDFFENCAELQKLYLDDSVKGQGLGYKLISMIEEKAKELGYERMYLETHSNLKVALHTYERSGYVLIDRPETVMHSSMNRFYLKELTDISDPKLQ